ncbi:MAG: HlyD family efflux transporter periplasmic adaptor subunit, partial [Burkholderiales bacterium]
EIRSRIQQRERETRRDLERELAEAQHEAELQRRRIDRLELEKKLTTLEAPSDGRVVGLAVHSAGAVVTAGATLLEIVPDHQPLHVEAQLPTQGIDRIKPGDQVQILFTSFNAATTPRVNGTLLTVAADALQDPTTRVPSYKILVEVSPDSLNGLKYSDLKPGMQAQVFISTGTRTFFDYLTRPVLDRMRKAFIEQ